MDKLLLVASFVTIHFGEWRQNWVGVPRFLPRNATSLFSQLPDQNQGVLAAFNCATRQLLWSLVLDTPSGFVLAPSGIHINSMHGARVLVFDWDLELRGTISNRYMNDLHSLTRHGDGFIVTSSGTDTVMQISEAGRPVKIWSAYQNGYPYAASGHRLRLDPQRDYRVVAIKTEEQATHCNSAAVARDGSTLVTLFHQGELLQLDPSWRQAKKLLVGLTKPHSIRKRPGGWMLSDTGANGLVLLDEEFRIADVVDGPYEWVQDALVSSDGRILIGDANHSRVVGFDPGPRTAQVVLEYPAEWKLFQMEICPPELEERVQHLRSSERVRTSV